MCEVIGMLQKIGGDAEVIFRYIEDLIRTPSPTGYTDLFAERIINYAQSHDIPFERTRKGAVFLKLESESAESSVMFAAHGDTLGCMVKETKLDGLVVTLLVVYLLSMQLGITATFMPVMGIYTQGLYCQTILPNILTTVSKR